MTFEDWKLVAMKVFPEVIEDKLIEFYKEATGVRGIKSTDEVTGEVTERLGIMDFDSYKKSMPMVINAKVLYNKLKDLEFK